MRKLIEDAEAKAFGKVVRAGSFGLIRWDEAEPASAIDWRGHPMPYSSNADLPSSVRHHLPEHAQSIYREAFNHAFAAHANDPRQEEAALRIAWAAVKRSYVKIGNDWVPRA
jgi:cation transport regulator